MPVDHQRRQRVRRRRGVAAGEAAAVEDQLGQIDRIGGREAGDVEREGRRDVEDREIAGPRRVAKRKRALARR
jgi:hypothetical protein